MIVVFVRMLAGDTEGHVLGSFQWSLIRPYVGRFRGRLEGGLPTNDQAFLAGRYPRCEEVGEGIPVSVSVALCSASSRTLRAGFAGAASGLLDETCARRSGRRQVGTRDGRCGQTPGCFVAQAACFSA